MKLAVLVAVLGLAVSGHALKCYSCKSSKPIERGVEVTPIDKPCTAFNKTPEFEQTCPDDFLGCVTITDLKDPKIIERGCISEDKTGCMDCDPNCYCNEDLCNGAGRVWPSFVTLLLAAQAAAVFAGR